MTSASWRCGPLTGLAARPVRGESVTFAVDVAASIRTSRVTRMSSSSRTVGSTASARATSARSAAAWACSASREACSQLPTSE